MTRKWAGRRAVCGWLLIAALAFEARIAAGDEARAPEAGGAIVEIAGGHGPIKAYLARPEGDGPFPAVVVIHEWWGLTDWIKQNADHLAGRGFVALAVDLYGGKATADPGEAHELMRALDDAEALADLKGGVAYLEKQAFVARDRPIGAIGWCMGGKFSRLLAQDSDAIGPAVICYGSVATDPAQIARLKDNPILGIFGADDRGIPAAKVEQFGEAVRAGGGRPEIHIYPKAGHGFMRPGGDQYAEEPAKDAWTKIDAFFDRTLKPARP